MPLLYVEVLKECNLRCVMCGYPTDYPTRGKRLTTDELKGIISDALELNTRVVSFGGGEPFMRRDIHDLIEHVGGLGMSMHINTNGTRIDEKRARRLSAANHLTLALSLDHGDPDKNDALRGESVFAHVESAALALRRWAPTVATTLNCVVGPHNERSIDKLVDLAARWGMQAIKFLPLHTNLGHRYKEDGLPDSLVGDPGHSRRLGAALEQARARAVSLGLETSSRAFLDRIPDYLDGTLEFPCYAGYLYGNIDPYGFMFPCYDHTEPLNVRDVGLLAAWRSDEMQRMRERVRGCQNPCWNSGNAEPSLRMDPTVSLRDPRQLLVDLFDLVA